ncbi:MAG: hypothetical protein JW889_04950 [Verrucomicrobia bacterium]|nr:hypothetical protein [Verrucomicrobiota bacterium]
MRLLTLSLFAAMLSAVATPLRAAEQPVPADATKPAEGLIRVLIRSTDLARGTDLAVDEKTVSIKTAHSGPLSFDRRAVAGIAFGPGLDRRIFEASGERDVLHMNTGDKISGDIIKTADGKVAVKTFYGGGRETEIEFDKISYMTFAVPTNETAIELKPDAVRVIFDNGDILGGTLAAFKNGVFRLDTQYAGAVEFSADRIQSLHNMANSRQFLPGGLAEAFMRLFDQSGELQRNFRNILLSLVQAFLAQGDNEGALFVLQRMERYSIDVWTYEQLARAFDNAKQTEAAILCYERMYEQRGNNVHVFRQIYQAYARYGRNSQAAEVYEELLKQPGAQLVNYGYKEPDIRMSLAETYGQLEEYQKAVIHLRKVLDDSSADSAMRAKARAMLVEDFRKIGTAGGDPHLDELVAKYSEELNALDERLGQEYLTLVLKYIELERLTKAGLALDEMKPRALASYVQQAQDALDKAYKERGWDESPDDEAGDDEAPEDQADGDDSE